MDLVLLGALESVRWGAVERAVDLGCGTGRTGAWLRSRGVARLDGIDLTPEMLEIARGRQIYDASFRPTRWPPGSRRARTTWPRRASWKNTCVTCARCIARRRVVDDRWITLKPGWARFRNHPVSFATAWQKR